MTSIIKNGAGKVPGLLTVLAMVPDPRGLRGRRYVLVFVLAVAAACTLAGAKTFREIGGQAADLPQSVLRDLGGRLHPLRRKIIAPSETRIRTLLHLIDTEILDEIIGGWLRGLADAGHLDRLLTAIAIDGKWLRGVADGQVKLFAAMLHEEKGHHRPAPDPGRDHRDHPGQGIAGEHGPGRRGGHRRCRQRAAGYRGVLTLRKSTRFHFGLVVEGFRQAPFDAT